VSVCGTGIGLVTGEGNVVSVCGTGIGIVTGE